ncbi:MAG: cupin domain-containing protein [Planctomycetota bacterium]|nr:MAG: cupin domain-containing protein [Planctomycetota bacterium]
MNDEENRIYPLATTLLGLDRNGIARPLEWNHGPPPSLDGYTIGAPILEREPPHDGEMHPDGDEILFLISGQVTLILEDQEPASEILLQPGQAIVVPRGVWHRIRLHEVSQILHVTPGPNQKLAQSIGGNF